MKHYYPAVFMRGVDCYEVIIPYVGCFTQGDDIAACMEMAQDALGVMFEGVAEKDYPAPASITDINLGDYPEGAFTAYVCFDKELYDALHVRRAIERADNPIRALLDHKRMKIKDLSDILHASYRTVQDWALGKSSPPRWALNLILDKILG